MKKHIKRIKEVVKKQIGKIGLTLTIFDTIVIIAVSTVAYFSIFSYYNAGVVKTEEYLTQFLLILKIVHYLGLIAFAHMIYTLFYVIYKKIKGKNEI